MTLFHLLNGNNYGVYNRSVAKKIGLHETIVLSELIDKYSYYKSVGKLISLPNEEGLWFFLTAENIEDRTTLKEKEQRLCIDHLVSLGFIKKKVAGIPAKRFFQIDEDKIGKFILNEISFTNFAKTPNLVGSDFPNENVYEPNKNRLNAKLVSSKRQTHIYKEPKEETNNIYGAEALPPPAPINTPNFLQGKYEDRIILYEGEYNDIRDKFGQELLTQTLDALYDYSINFPKKFKRYSNHAATVRSWARKTLQTMPVSKIPHFQKNKDYAAKRKADVVNLLAPGSKILLKDRYVQVEIERMNFRENILYKDGEAAFKNQLNLLFEKLKTEAERYSAEVKNGLA
jgi:hypothetical protein